MNKPKPSKAERLANNIKRDDRVRINSKNKKAAIKAIELLGMKLDEFIFEIDCDNYIYINIIKKCPNLIKKCPNLIKKCPNLITRPKYPPT